MHLRLCMICGHVGCCDSSPHRHATAHFDENGHPLIQSFEPGEDWWWCYVDEFAFGSTASRTSSTPEELRRPIRPTGARPVPPPPSRLARVATIYGEHLDRRGAGRRRSRRVPATLALVAVALPGCSLFATPYPAPVHDPSSAPPGRSATWSAPTPSPRSSWTPAPPRPTFPSPSRNAGARRLRHRHLARRSMGLRGHQRRGCVIPPPWPPPTTCRSDLGVVHHDGTVPRRRPPAPSKTWSYRSTWSPNRQNARSHPRQGGTHAIVVLPGGRTMLAASGNTIVPVDAEHPPGGRPARPGRRPHRLRHGARPGGHHPLRPGGRRRVIPVDTANATAGTDIPTGLSVSSVYSPHGIVVTADGATVYVVGQGGTDFGGRILPIAAATGAPGPATGFDRFGISDPAAIALSADGSTLLVADSANNWVNPVAVATFSDPLRPVRLPQRIRSPRRRAPSTPPTSSLGPGPTGRLRGGRASTR